jgi:hypothetical protein
VVDTRPVDLDAARELARAEADEDPQDTTPRVIFQDAGRVVTPLPKKRLDHLPAGKRPIYVVDGRPVDPEGNVVEGVKWDAESQKLS